MLGSSVRLPLVFIYLYRFLFLLPPRFIITEGGAAPPAKVSGDGGRKRSRVNTAISPMRKQVQEGLQEAR